MQIISTEDNSVIIQLSAVDEFDSVNCVKLRNY